MKKSGTRYAFALALFIAFSGASADENPSKSPAEIFSWLEGDWRFTLGSRSGTRTYRVIEPGHAVVWNEGFDDSDLTGDGISTYIDAERRYVSLSVHNRADAAGLMFGAPNPSLDQIIFRPQFSESDTEVEIIWTRNGEDAFGFHAYSVSENERKLLWTAQFTRVIK